MCSFNEEPQKLCINKNDITKGIIFKQYCAIIFILFLFKFSWHEVRSLKIIYTKKKEHRTFSTQILTYSETIALIYKILSFSDISLQCIQ